MVVPSEGSGQAAYCPRTSKYLYNEVLGFQTPVFDVCAYDIRHLALGDLLGVSVLRRVKRHRVKNISWCASKLRVMSQTRRWEHHVPAKHGRRRKLCSR